MPESSFATSPENSGGSLFSSAPSGSGRRKPAVNRVSRLMYVEVARLSGKNGASLRTRFVFPLRHSTSLP